MGVFTYTQNSCVSIYLLASDYNDSAYFFSLFQRYNNI